MTPEQIVEFAEGLAAAVASKGGVEALAARLSAAGAGCGVIVDDAQGRRVATAGTPTAGAGRAIDVLSADACVGRLTVWGAGDSLNLPIRVAAAAIGVELGRTGGSERGRRTAFWERLLGRTYHDAGAARADAAASGIVPAPAYLAVAIELDASGESTDGGAAKSELRAVAADVFRAAHLGFLERGAALLMLVPAAREIDASNARTAATLLPKSLNKRAPHLRVSGGIGTVEPMLGAAASADAAICALAIGRRVYGSGRVVAYQDLGAYPVLYEGADVHRLQTFARDVLAPLRAYDEKHQTELERTLRLYFEVGQNVKTAAAQLSVHRHTVFYRLRQIGEICGRTLESPHDQLTIRLAVAIDALHSS